MENEVSGIAKLGIVLIALAVLIGLGFGIFQISKSTANTGVGNVQAELDSVSQSTFTTYDQTTITGTMASSAVSDFEGDSVAVLIATQAWTDLCGDVITGTAGTFDALGADDLNKGAGFNTAYAGNTDGSAAAAKEGMAPIVWCHASSDADSTACATTATSKGGDAGKTNLGFINYNAILGSTAASGTSLPAGVTTQVCNFGSFNAAANMAYIYFDSNCYRCVSGFATTSSGKTIFNNVASNLSKTGKTEYIPSGAKFESFLVKDASGTTMGVAFQQINGN